MTSLFAKLYLALQTEIATQVPEIQWIDQDLGQLEAFDTRPSVAFPCVLIDFATTQYKDEGQGWQWADVTISLRLGFAPFSSANSIAPDISKEAALNFYEIEHKLCKTINGFTANNCVQPLVRISSSTEKREDFLRVREIIFTTATEDDSDADYTNKVKAPLELEQ